jgi:hypothetical protein
MNKSIWTPVGEGTPKGRKHVLCAVEVECAYELANNPGVFESRMETYYTEGFYNHHAQDWFTVTRPDIYFRETHVVAWTDLPEPYKREGEQ